MAKVSLVITCHNQEQYLSELLQLLDDFSFLLSETEIIVLDSSDIPARVSCDVPVHRISNLGPSASRNKGAALANGEWLVFCDADDFVNPLMINFLINAGNFNHFDALFFPYRRVYDDIFLEEAGRFYKSVTMPNAIKHTVINGPVFFLHHFYPVHAVAIKRKVFENVRFNELQWLIEDVRFYTQLAVLSGVELCHIEESDFISFHRDFKTRKSLSASNELGFWTNVAENFDFVVANYSPSFKGKLQLVTGIITNYHIVNESCRAVLERYNSVIWNYFGGLPRFFKRPALYRLLLNTYRFVKKWQR